MIRLNLLADTRNGRRITRRGVAAALACACGVVMIAGGVAAWEYRQVALAQAAEDAAGRRSRRAPAEKGAERADAAEAEDERHDLAARVASLEKERSGHATAIRLLAHVGRSVPDDVWLTLLNRENDIVSIEGLGLSHSAVAEFLTNLDTDGPFAGPVDLVGSSLQPAPRRSEAGADRDVIEFSIRIRLASSEQAADSVLEPPALRTGVEDARRRLVALYAGARVRRDAGALLAELEQHAADSRVRLLGFSPRTDTKEHSDSWVAALRLEGTYDSLFTFLARLGEESATHTLKNLEITTHPDQDAAVTVAVECTVAVLLRPPGQSEGVRDRVVGVDSVRDSLAADPIVPRDPFIRVRARREAEPPPAGEQPRPAGLAGLAIADATLRGTLETPQGGVAFLLADDGRTHVVRPGDELFDGVVVSVAPNALVVRPRSRAPEASPMQGEVLTMVLVAEPK